MPLINCKFELKFKCKNNCYFSAAGVGDDNVHPDNIIFTIKDTKPFSKGF